MYYLIYELIYHRENIEQSLFRFSVFSITTMYSELIFKILFQVIFDSS